VRDVQSGPPLGPSRSKGSEAGCRLSSGSSRRSKCPPRFVRGCRAAGRRGSVPNGDSRRVGVAKSSRSTRARRGSVDVSMVMFGAFSVANGGRGRQGVRLERVVARAFCNGIRQGIIPPGSAGSPGSAETRTRSVSSNRARPASRVNARRTAVSAGSNHTLVGDLPVCQLIIDNRIRRQVRARCCRGTLAGVATCSCLGR
jgi:hypothetical protein